MPEYIKVVEVKDGYYVNEVLDRDNVILFNITDDVREAYQVPPTTFAEFVLESKGRESFETRLLNATHGRMKMFKQDLVYIEQPEGLTSVVNKDGTIKEDK